MGAKLGCEPSVGAESKDTVKLNIYDVSGTRIVEEANKIFRALGTGAFHAAVEVFGKEWSFAFCEQGSGVFQCEPRHCSQHTYRETINMGDTDLTEEEFGALIERLRSEWQGCDYDLLRKNCCTFSNELCTALHVQEVPKWVTNLAGAGATVNKGVQEAMVKGGEGLDKAKAAAIIAAAKAGEVDEKYQIRGQAQAKAQELLIKAGELEQKWELHKHAETFANGVQEHATKLGGHLTKMFGQTTGQGATASK